MRAITTIAIAAGSGSSVGSRPLSSPLKATFKISSIGSIIMAAKKNPLNKDHNDPKKNAGQHHPFFTALKLPLEFEYMLNSLIYSTIIIFTILHPLEAADKFH